MSRKKEPAIRITQEIDLTESPAVREAIQANYVEALPAPHARRPSDHSEPFIRVENHPGLPTYRKQAPMIPPTWVRLDSIAYAMPFNQEGGVVLLSSGIELNTAEKSGNAVEAWKFLLALELAGVIPSHFTEDAVSTDHSKMEVPHGEGQESPGQENRGEENQG